MMLEVGAVYRCSSAAGGELYYFEIIKVFEDHCTVTYPDNSTDKISRLTVEELLKRYAVYALKGQHEYRITRIK